MKSDNAITIAQVAASVQTVGQARAVLGKISELLREAYAKLEDVTNIEGVRDAARSRIDVVNAYAGGIYAVMPSDQASQDLPLDANQARRVGLAMAQAQDALKDTEEAAGLEVWDVSAILSETVASVGGTVGGGLSSVTNSIAAGGAAFVSAAWPVVIVALVLVGGYAVYRFRGAIA